MCDIKAKNRSFRGRRETSKTQERDDRRGRVMGKLIRYMTSMHGNATIYQSYCMITKT